MTCDWCTASGWVSSTPAWIGAFGNSDMEIWICRLCDYHFTMIGDKTGDPGGIYAPLAENGPIGESDSRRFAIEWEVRKL